MSEQEREKTGASFGEAEVKNSNKVTVIMRTGIALEAVKDDSLTKDFYQNAKLTTIDKNPHPPSFKHASVPLLTACDRQQGKTVNDVRLQGDLHHLDPDLPENDEMEIAHEGHKPTTKLATFVNLLKANIGTGILSLPYAMKNAGLGVGLAGMILAGFICIYCMHQLLGVYRRVSRRRPHQHLDYAEVAEACFEDAPQPWLQKLAPYAAHTINLFLVVTQLGACCVYLNFAADMIQQVIEAYTDFEAKFIIYQGAIAALLIPYCLVRHLHILAIFSTLANGLTMASLAIAMQYVFRNLRPHDELPLVTSPKDFFLFYGAVMFSYESITFVLPFETKMKDRSSFHYWNGLMTLTMVCIIGIYTVVAFYGYLAFGVNAQFLLKDLPQEGWYVFLF